MFAVCLVCALACLVCLPAAARGQQPRVGITGAAPPPMRFIPDEERERLAQQTRDHKARTRLSLDLADARLRRAAELTDAERYDAAAVELGIYQAIIEDAFTYLEGTGRPPQKMRDIYKRIEMTLRAHGPRLENIRRATPSDEAVNVRAAYEYIRQARADALNAFYGDTVVRERQQPDDKGKAANEGLAKEPKPNP